MKSNNSKGGLFVTGQSWITFAIDFQESIFFFPNRMMIQEMRRFFVCMFCSKSLLLVLPVEYTSVVSELWIFTKSICGREISGACSIECS